MKFIMEYQANRSGIYAILNLMEKRIYIGKATKLQVRAYQHRDDLRKNLEPNLELQRDYNKPNARLIDFSLVEDVAQEDLLYYESLYIYVARSWENDESEISRLYNCSKSKIDLNGLVKNYNKEKSKVESDLEAAKENFNQALQIRFGGRGPSEVVKMQPQELAEIVKEYEKSEYKKYRTGELKRDSLLSCPDFNFKLYSLYDDSDCEKINLDYTIFTTIGSYLDQDIYEIFKEKFEDLNSNGYCLWALNKLNAKTVRKFCREQKGKPIYVIMWYTTSKDRLSELIEKLGGFKSENGYEDVLGKLKQYFIQEARENYIGYEHFREKDIREIEKENQTELKNLKMEENYRFPTSLPHIETGRKKWSFGEAFVIDEFGVLKQNINKEEFLDQYEGYTKGNYGTKEKKAIDILMPWSEKKQGRKMGCQNDSLCMKKYKDGNVSKEDSPYINFVVARLLPPYFVELDGQKFNGERRRTFL